MIKLTGNKVAVTPIFDPDMSPGGIIIPDIAKERCDQGIVKYIGPEVKDIKVGMYVIYSGYSGTLVDVQGEGSFILLPEEFIVAELPEPANVDIPGLYFRGRFDRALAHRELFDLIKVIMDGFMPDEIASEMSSALLKAGVYGPAANPYFQANYESAMGFISEAFRNSQWYKELKIKVPNPKYNSDNIMEPV